MQTSGTPGGGPRGIIDHSVWGSFLDFLSVENWAAFLGDEGIVCPIMCSVKALIGFYDHHMQKKQHNIVSHLFLYGILHQLLFVNI